MPLAYYSLANVGDIKCERQWSQSIRSLRAYNNHVPVHLVVYNVASDAVLREADRHQIMVHRVGDYQSRIHDLIPQHAAALCHYPSLHKILSLQFLPVGDASQVLYLDCDTFFLGDVMNLFRKYRSHHFYAREEPWSRRSHYGYRPSYLDERLLAATVESEGLTFIPPYNTGVCMLNRGLWMSLAQACSKFLGYLWRLLLDICNNDQLARECSSTLLHELRLGRKRSRDSALTYPSSNWWIVEEIAMLMTLGSIPGVTHDALHKEDAVQNGEYDNPSRSAHPVVVHYFSHFEERFFQRVPRL
jgi:hypothetical protein